MLVIIFSLAALIYVASASVFFLASILRTSNRSEEQYANELIADQESYDSTDSLPDDEADFVPIHKSKDKKRKLTRRGSKSDCDNQIQVGTCEPDAQYCTIKLPNLKRLGLSALFGIPDSEPQRSSKPSSRRASDLTSPEEMRLPKAEGHRVPPWSPMRPNYQSSSPPVRDTDDGRLSTLVSMETYPPSTNIGITCVTATGAVLRSALGRSTTNVDEPNHPGKSTPSLGDDDDAMFPGTTYLPASRVIYRKETTQNQKILDDWLLRPSDKMNGDLLHSVKTPRMLNENIMQNHAVPTTSKPDESDFPKPLYLNASYSVADELRNKASLSSLSKYLEQKISEASQNGVTDDSHENSIIERDEPVKESNVVQHGADNISMVPKDGWVSKQRRELENGAKIKTVRQRSSSCKSRIPRDVIGKTQRSMMHNGKVELQHRQNLFTDEQDQKQHPLDHLEQQLQQLQRQVPQRQQLGQAQQRTSCIRPHPTQPRHPFTRAETIPNGNSVTAPIDDSYDSSSCEISEFSSLSDDEDSFRYTPQTQQRRYSQSDGPRRNGSIKNINKNANKSKGMILRIRPDSARSSRSRQDEQSGRQSTGFTGLRNGTEHGHNILSRDHPVKNDDTDDNAGTILNGNAEAISLDATSDNVSPAEEHVAIVHHSPITTPSWRRRRPMSQEIWSEDIHPEINGHFSDNYETDVSKPTSSVGYGQRTPAQPATGTMANEGIFSPTRQFESWFTQDCQPAASRARSSRLASWEYEDFFESRLGRPNHVAETVITHVSKKDGDIKQAVGRFNVSLPGHPDNPAPAETTPQYPPATSDKFNGLPAITENIAHTGPHNHKPGITRQAADLSNDYNGQVKPETHRPPSITEPVQSTASTTANGIDLGSTDESTKLRRRRMNHTCSDDSEYHPLTSSLHAPITLFEKQQPQPKRSQMPWNQRQRLTAASVILGKAREDENEQPPSRGNTKMLTSKFEKVAKITAVSNVDNGVESPRKLPTAANDGECTSINDLTSETLIQPVNGFLTNDQHSSFKKEGRGNHTTTSNSVVTNGKPFGEHAFNQGTSTTWKPTEGLLPTTSTVTVPSLNGIYTNNQNPGLGSLNSQKHLSSGNSSAGSTNLLVDNHGPARQYFRNNPVESQERSSVSSMEQDSPRMSNSVEYNTSSRLTCSTEEASSNLSSGSQLFVSANSAFRRVPRQQTNESSSMDHSLREQLMSPTSVEVSELSSGLDYGCFENEDTYSVQNYGSLSSLQSPNYISF